MLILTIYLLWRLKMKGRDVVLGLLNTKSRSGYEIKEIVEDQLAYFFDASIGMIYPTLRNLEKEGKIQKTRVYQTDKPNKNVYTITDSGKKEFAQYLKSPIAQDIYKSDCLMRLYLGTELSDKEITHLIQQELKHKQELLQHLQDSYQDWQSKGMNKRQKITLDYGIATYKAAINALESAKQDLQP